MSDFEILDAVSDGLLVADASCRILAANAVACAMTGCPREDLLSLSLPDVLQDAKAILAARQASSPSGGRFRLQSSIACADGTRRRIVGEIASLPGGRICVRFNQPEHSGPPPLDIDRAALSIMSLDHINDSVVWISADGSIVSANASAHKHFAAEPHTLINRKMYDIDPHFGEKRWRLHWSELEDRKSLRFETAHIVGGRSVPVEVSANLIDYQGRTLNCAVFHDISQRKLMESRSTELTARLRALSLTDHLSGLGNRRQFERWMRDEFARQRRRPYWLSLILIDLDKFKAYNDTYGHSAGDECLQCASRVLLQAARRRGEHVARIGGEEFACFLPSTSHADAIRIAQSMRNGIRALRIPHVALGKDAIVTASLGVVTINDLSKSSPKDLYDAADRCLYMAKANGRDCVVHRDLSVVATAEPRPQSERGIPSRQEEALLAL